MLKKILLILLIFPFFSCTNFIPQPRDILPRTSFLHVRKTLTVVKCENNQCTSRDFRSAASAFIVQIEKEGSFAITAAHVCENKVPPDMESKTTKTSAIYTMRRLDGERYTASVLTYDTDIDVCLMFVKDLVEGIEAVKISPTKPQPGDRIYNISAPIAIFRPNMVPIIEGQYNGETSGIAWYTLMAAPGSSGSMVVNENGELVGLVHSVYVHFPIITLGTPYEELLHFIKKNLHKYVVYKNVMDVLELENVFES
jgi:S1-C subfamily serine protease